MKILDENGLRRLNQHLQATYAKKSTIGTAAEAPNIQNPTTVWEAINQAASKGGGSDPELMTMLISSFQETVDNLDGIYGAGGAWSLSPDAEDRNAVTQEYLGRLKDLTAGISRSMTGIVAALQARGIDPGQYKLEQFASLIKAAKFFDLATLGVVTPGADSPIAGDLNLGYFGTVSSSELGTFDDGPQAGQLLTAASLAAQVGITAGTKFNDDITWHKFIRDSELIIVAQKPIRYNLSWVNIASAGCVFGRNVQSIGGVKYRITLLKGLSAEFANYHSNDGSEWNDLMIPLTDGRFANLTDEDLGVKSGNGYRSWCQDTTDSTVTVNSTSYSGLSRSLRGSGSVAGAIYNYASSVFTNYGWRPALRFTL